MRRIECLTGWGGGPSWFELEADVEPTGDIPPGATIVLEYTCGGCGTRYRWDSTTHRRVIVDGSTEETGVTLEPGASHEFEFQLPMEGR